MPYIFMLVFVLSCATRTPEVVFEPNKNLWIGRSSDEVMLHPEFAVREMTTRKASDGSELFTFKNSGGVHSSGGCYTYNGISSCSSSSGEIVCNHLFLVKGGKVIDYYRNGACAEEQLQFRPRDKSGNPVLAESELRQLDVQRGVASNEKRDCSLAGKILRAQGCN